MQDRPQKFGNSAILRPFLKGQVWRYAGALAAMILSTLALYVTPLIGARVIDHVVSGKPLDAPWGIPELIESWGGRATLAQNLWVAAGAVVLFTAVSGFLSYLKDRWATLASETVTRRLRDRLYDHLQHLPCSYHDKAQTGDLVQRCTSDVETVKGLIGGQMVELVRPVVMLAGVLPFMLMLSVKMTILAMAMIPLIILFAIIFFSKVKTAFKASDEAEGAMTTVLQENLTGIRVVRAFARQDFECEKFARGNALFRDTTYKLIRLMAIYWSSSDFLCHIQNGLVLVFGAYWILQGELGVGSLFAFVAYENMFMWPVRQTGRILTDLGKAQVSLGRLREILSHPVEHPAVLGADGDLGSSGLKGEGGPKGRVRVMPQATPALAGSIAIRDLSYTFNGKSVLDGVSLDVKAGQTIAILGPSGSGKSVLIHLLLRMYDYEQGSILIDGRELRDMDRKAIRGQVGVVLQEPFLYSKTLKDNIGLGRRGVAEREIHQAGQAACIHESIMEFEKAYDTLVGERGVTLSGGQRQRVALARALLRDPAILILDDALSAVDTRTESMILATLKRRHGRRTTLLISHRLSALKQADTILVLEGGRVVQSGTHDELLATDGLYRRLWQIQSNLEEDLSQELAV